LGQGGQGGGVIMECAELAMGPCNAREDCRWVMDRCEGDPRHMACADLQPNECVLREDCEWSRAQDACVARPEGDCAELNPLECEARADCEAVEADDLFLCLPRGLDCRERPVEACEADPGCVLEEVDCQAEDGVDCGVGVACTARRDGPDRCEAIEDREACAAAGCEVAGVLCDCPEPVPCMCPPGADCDCAEPEPCECPEWACITPIRPAACADLPIERCEAAPGCHVERLEACGCADGGPGDPDDPAEPCGCEIIEICVDDGQGEPCEALDAGACLRRADCQWENLPGACGCWIDDAGNEICDCDGGEPGGGICLPVDQPDGCGALGEAACQASGDCEWVPGPGMCACRITPDGQEICECDDGAGACVDAWRPEGCALLDEAECQADPNCLLEWLPVPCPPCRDGFECPPCDPVPVCMERGPRGCEGLDADACAADAACMLVEEELCAMPEPGPDGDAPCDQPDLPCGEPGEPICQLIERCLPAERGCGAIREADACAAAGCQPLQGAADEFLGCAQAGGEGCWALGAQQCPFHPACELAEGPVDCWCEIDEAGNEICGCGGGMAVCMPADQGGGGGGGEVPPPVPEPMP
ncbi:MAG: hypothetical protein KC613_19435, partial [Myxococcales bacterium]|nr:hypothetical protein [Myxococcales bacterium]